MAQTQADEVALPPEQRIDLLAGVPGFAGLPASTLAELSLLFSDRSFAAGAMIVTEGEAADQLFVVVDGRAEVSTIESTGPVALATLGRGELFGEVALMPMGQRTATVTALTPLRLLTVESAALDQWLRDQPQVRANVSAAADVMATAQFLKQASPFSTLDAARRRTLAERLSHRQVPAGTEIIREGEPRTSCYLVRSG